MKALTEAVKAGYEVAFRPMFERPEWVIFSLQHRHDLRGWTCLVNVEILDDDAIVAALIRDAMTRVDKVVILPREVEEWTP